MPLHRFGMLQQPTANALQRSPLRGGHLGQEVFCTHPCIVGALAAGVKVGEAHGKNAFSLYDTIKV